MLKARFRAGHWRVPNSGLRTRYDYDPWGRRINVNGGNFEADFGFTGHYYHAPSGLQLALYRAYSAELGRWLNRDPLKNAELVQGPNLYGYVDQQPLLLTDPLGQDSTKGGKFGPILKLVKSLKEAWDLAQNGKCPGDPCKIPSSLSAYCTCMWDAFQRSKSSNVDKMVDELAKCICQTDQNAYDAECEGQVRDPIRKILHPK